jgi:hypothetical protein
MILRRLGGGDEAYLYTRDPMVPFRVFRLYVEEADNDPGIRRASLATKIAL